jgi:hypothetical protein
MNCGNAAALNTAPNLTGVASNSLYLVSSAMQFEFDSALKNLSFPNLTEIREWLVLNTLPLLTEFEFGHSLNRPTNTIIFSTGLKSFSASLSDTSNDSGGYFHITQNKDMSQIHLGLEAWSAANCAGEDYCPFQVSDNAPGATIDLPNLVSLNGDALFGDFSSLNIPELQVVSGGLNISNAQVYRFSAPNLRKVGGNFSLTGNSLEYVLFSELMITTANDRLL